MTAGPEQTVSIKNNSYGWPTTWEWTWGDGRKANCFEPTHRYTAPGRYQITLRASNYAGVSYATKSIYVGTTAATLSVATYQAGLAVGFANTSDIFAEQIVWDFGDGTTSSDKQPTHTYVATGTYTYRANMKTAAGPKRYKGTVVVTGVGATALPSAAFSHTDDASVGDSVAFTNLSTGAGLTYAWDFRDGSTSTSASPSHTFTGPGIYQVRLTVTDSGGVKSTVHSQVAIKQVAAIMVKNPYVADFDPVKFIFGHDEVFNMSSTTPDGDYEVEFDMGDGTKYSKRGVQHDYSASTYGYKVVSYRLADKSSRDATLKAITIVAVDPAIGAGAINYAPMGEIYSSSYIYRKGETITAIVKNKAAITGTMTFNNISKAIVRSVGGSWVTDGFAIDDIVYTTDSKYPGPYLVTGVGTATLAVKNLDESTVTFDNHSADVFVFTPATTAPASVTWKLDGQIIGMGMYVTFAATTATIKTLVVEMSNSRGTASASMSYIVEDIRAHHPMVTDPLQLPSRPAHDFRICNRASTSFSNMVWDATAKTVTRVTGSWLEEGWNVGDYILFKTSTSNNKFIFKVSAVTRKTITITNADGSAATLTTRANDIANYIYKGSRIGDGVFLVGDGLTFDTVSELIADNTYYFNTDPATSGNANWQGVVHGSVIALNATTATARGPARVKSITTGIFSVTVTVSAVNNYAYSLTLSATDSIDKSYAAYTADASATVGEICAGLKAALEAMDPAVAIEVTGGVTDIVVTAVRPGERFSLTPNGNMTMTTTTDVDSESTLTIIGVDESQTYPDNSDTSVVAHIFDAIIPMAISSVTFFSGDMSMTRGDSGGSFIIDGFAIGDTITTSSTAPDNRGPFRVISVAEATMRLERIIPGDVNGLADGVETNIMVMGTTPLLRKNQTGTFIADITGFTYGRYTIAWDMGDGTTITTQTRFAHHAYSSAGQKTIACTITDGQTNGTLVITQQVYVEPDRDEAPVLPDNMGDCRIVMPGTRSIYVGDEMDFRGAMSSPQVPGISDEWRQTWSVIDHGTGVVLASAVQIEDQPNQRISFKYRALQPGFQQISLQYIDPGQSMGFACTRQFFVNSPPYFSIGKRSGTVLQHDDTGVLASILGSSIIKKPTDILVMERK